MMKSAFDARIATENGPSRKFPNTYKATECKSFESDTEDEEVKLNCASGARGMEDSDLNSVSARSEGDDFDESDEENIAAEERAQGVVAFSSVNISRVHLLQPKPCSPTRPRLSPLDERSMSDDGSLRCCEATKLCDEDETQDGTMKDEMKELEESKGDAQRLRRRFLHDVAAYVGDESPLSSEDDALDKSEPDADAMDFVSILDPLDESTGHGHGDDLLERCIGVLADQETKHQVTPKRVLSFSTLSLLSPDSRSTHKRSRVYENGPAVLNTPAGPCAVLEFVRNDSPNICSTLDDQEVDIELEGRLRDELGGCDSNESRENTPVPLLTPAASPVPAENDDASVTVICEWPSNLYVDSAMTSAAELRPLSPTSLQVLEVEEGHRFATQRESFKLEADTVRMSLLRGIYVD